MKFFYIEFFGTGAGFPGWNGVWANSLKEAKEELKKKVGSYYTKINWKTLLVGKKAEDAAKAVWSLGD